MVRIITIMRERDKVIQKLRKMYPARILYTEFVFSETTVDTHTRIYAGNGQTMEDAKV